MPRDEFGNETIVCRWYVEAKACGVSVWKGVFDNRGDFDEFLWSMASGTLGWDQYVQHLPRPWFDPDLLGYEGLHWIYAATRQLTGTSGSNQTDTVPSDWNSVNNFIDCIASGGSGAACGQSGNAGTGGSGAGWSRQTNVTLTPGGSATYRLSAGGASVSVGFANSNGNAGADCWYNGASLGAASVGAKGGLAGTRSISITSGSAGGAAGSGVGSSKNSGGASGSANSNSNAELSGSGGGGAATVGGNGVASGNANPSSQTSGGNSGSGAAGGGTGATGTAGTEYGSVGGGGGGGGNSNGNGGSGGLYGSGGGAGCLVAGVASGQGRQALIRFDYVPLVLIPWAGHRQLPVFLS